MKLLLKMYGLTLHASVVACWHVRPWTKYKAYQGLSVRDKSIHCCFVSEYEGYASKSSFVFARVS